MRKLLVILVTFLLMVNGTGCSLLVIGNVKKRYTLEEGSSQILMPNAATRSPSMQYAQF